MAEGIAAGRLPPLPHQPGDTPWPGESWPSGPPAPGVDADRLKAVLDRPFATEAPTDEMGLSLAAVVVHRGQLVGERYAASAGPDEPLISWSMAKSVTHAAIGLLVADGNLSLDGPAPVPEWSDPEDPRHAITVDQLLHMMSGLEFNEDYVDEGTSHCLEMLWGEAHADMAHYAASQALLHPPGSVFNYSSGTSNIVARLIGDGVGPGPATEAWLHERLFTPIGMASAEPRFDPAGTFVGSSYVYATARDFARFGLLYLRDGVWDGTRILPEGWVDHARTVVGIDPEDGPYGAHWWVKRPGEFWATGYEAQRIRCVPDADLVVVRLGKTDVSMAPAVDAWFDEIVDCFPREPGR